MVEFLNKKVIPKIMAFVNTKPVTALKDGMVFTMPLLIVGSIFLIIANFPIESIKNWLEVRGITEILNQAYGATFNISALIAVIGIAYSYAKLEGQEPLNSGFVAMAVFFLIQPSTLESLNGDIVSNIVNKDWTAGKGMIGAIIVGLLVGKSYSWFLKKNIRIKMPAGVPEGVSNAFSSLIPAAAIVAVTTLIQGIFMLGFHTTFIEIIYTILQIPLQGMTDSLPGALLMCALIPFLWFFGVHGSTLVGGIMQGLLTANTLANQAIIDSGLELTLENGGHIVTQQFLDQFINVTGAGITIGLTVYMLAFAKSQQLKTIGKLEIVPALFNINEPVLFGVPIVMNPLIALPFVVTPILACIIQYIALATGLCPLYGGILVPWTCPPVISGFLIGGWRTALLQLVILVMSFFVYLPFARKIDKMKYQEETASAASDDNDDDW